MEIDALIEAERQKPQMVQFRNHLSWVSGPWGIAQDMADELLRTIDVSVWSEMVRKQDRHWKFRFLEHQPDLSPQEGKRQQQEFPNTIWDAEEYHHLEAAGAFNPDNESWDDDEDVVRHAPTPPESMRTSPSPHQQSSTNSIGEAERRRHWTTVAALSALIILVRLLGFIVASRGRLGR
ncbi:hypothetical protein GJ744_011329 [Endocarpon pusillum]|uniref:Uncharacterized protein n=1 Tax=Endocarpon pusillum TaxID=364733 RepID=A0A8H7APV7_9EURO|nr:hypothetical protein GJ744_011329 [Endocarpon pusillum]